MKRLDAPLALGLASAIVLAANAAILGGAWWNRSGEPEATLELTERELAMPLSRDRDDTGLVLALALADRPPAAAVLAASLRHTPLPPFEHPWLDAAKLRELGFDREAVEAATAGAAGRDGERGSAARRTFVVLENDGEAWHAWLTAAEDRVRELRRRVEAGEADRARLDEAEALLALDRTSRSRLWPVDAGLDPARLRERYPDRRRYAVVPGAVGLVPDFSIAGASGLRPTISRIAPHRVHVPLGLLAGLEAFVPRVGREELLTRAREAAAAGWPAPAPPRYRATVAFGRGYRPWLVSVAPIEPTR